MNEPELTVFYVLDLDRTLLDTSKSTELMRGVLALHDPELAALLEQRFEDYTLLGESFSMRDFIVEQIGEEGIAPVEAKYKHMGQTMDLLNPGAGELLEYLRLVPNSGFGIMTYGSSLGQAMKIEAGNLAGIPYLVTAETFKGQQIASWRQDDGMYHLPEELGGMTTTSIVFVDDKPFSFKGLPIDCVGYLVKSVYDAGLEDLPMQVSVCNDLFEVITAETTRLQKPQN